ncbi:MAG: hypothetical protein IIA09_16300, partial [Proteobacteria bacterium]|nr:hypothetical protein [Pseudomonadota bacterium]
MQNNFTPSSALGFLMRATSILISACLLAAALVSPASATHFRYGSITWTQAGGNAVNVTLQMASRRTFYTPFGCLNISSGTPAPTACTGPGGDPGIGDIVNPFETFIWGDSSSTSVFLKVTSIDPANDWLFGVALDPASFPAEVTTLPHTYAGPPADFLAFFERCCRINITATGAVHQNNLDRGFSVETLINVGGTNNSPVTAVAPIVLCRINSFCDFSVPAADPDGDTVSFRLSTSAEAKGLPLGGQPDAFVQPGPPDAPNAASIDMNTGLYTWDTTGANGVIGDFYSTQVTIEDGDSKIAVDFLIQLSAADPNPPTIVGDPAAVCGPA